MSKEYLTFLQKKKHSSGNFGFDPVWMPDFLFDFQKYVIEKGLIKGRNAYFLDTGLGKTAIQLVVAENVIRKTNRKALILTPLAVAFQFLKEAEKFGIDDIEYCKDGNHTKKIVVANYERLHYFKPEDFEIVLLDESSILKNFDGAIKGEITSFIKKVKYRSLATATPSPNDFIELGTSSEALGYMGYTDMLTKFFTNNEDTIKPQNIGTKWILKGHAENKFFDWVSSWSISLRKPSDLGFSDEKFILPELITNYHSVKNDENLVVNGQIQLYNQIARTLPEVRDEQRSTVTKRCERAVELTNDHETSVYWCNRNDEGDLLEKLDKDAYQIKGSMTIEKKEELLLAFSEGQIKKLITKAKMTGFGLNWQHCNHTVYFPTFSFEQYYQALRRFWRFGQKSEVVADVVYSDGQQRVLDSIKAKGEKANNLFNKLNMSVNSDYQTTIKQFDKIIQLPNFLQS
jgi:hypothetical protein